MLLAALRYVRREGEREREREREWKAIFSAAAKREEKWMLQKFLSPRKTVSNPKEQARLGPSLCSESPNVLDTFPDLIG